MAEQEQELLQLKWQVESVCDAIDEAADSNLPGRDDLEKICEVLKQIKAGVVSFLNTEMRGSPAPAAAVLLPQSKREELIKLLPTIKRALQQRKQQAREPDPAAAAAAAAVSSEEKKLPAAAAAIGCNPSFFKPRPLQQQQSNNKQESSSSVEEEDEGVPSLKLLLRLTQDVLEPEQFYEWTTSYVDEDRIYGWQEEADELAAALVAGDGDEVLFRAAGIAGVHGSGKTALAQKVFVHDKAKDNFALRLWVCVGPPDSEDRFGLLYRMLDNLGLDTAKVEDVVDKSSVVEARRRAVEASIRSGAGDDDKAKLEEIRNKAAARYDAQQQQKREEEEEEEDSEFRAIDERPDDKEESIFFEEVLREEVEESRHVRNSKMGVLLYILHTTLSRTSYLIVFDDIRAYGDDGWYSNLALPPPAEGEWGDRLAYGLPKPKKQHRAAVLLTCRNEEHARSMVRSAGRVVRPPRLDGEPAWKLFEREYRQAKGNKSYNAEKNDMLYEELKEMKQNIVDKCLGLPVAIAEAAKGFAALQPLPPDDDDASDKDMQPAATQQELKVADCHTRF